MGIDKNTTPAVPDTTTLQALVAKSTRDAVIITDASGHICWVNSAFEHTSGYTLGEISGRKPGDFLQGPDTSRESQEALGKAIRARTPTRVEILNYTRAGAPYWVDIALSPVFDDAGELQYFVAVQRPINEKKQLEQVNRQFEAVHRALDQQAIVSMTDRAGRIIYANPLFCAISGYSFEELQGKTHRIVNSGHHDRSFFKDMWGTIAAGNAWHGEVCNRAKDGSVYWVDTTIVPVQNETGRIESFMSIRFDITERKRAEHQLRRLAEQDDLTGLANRRTLLARLHASMGRRRRARDAAGGALMLLDMDHFKYVNDTRGHHFGDAVLCAIGERLLHETRDAVVARLGGDEFAVLIDPAPATGRDLESLIARIYASLRCPVVTDEGSITASFSMGITCFPMDAQDPATLLKNADIAMYEAKRLGRGRWHFFNAELQAELSASYRLEERIRHAVQTEAFTVAMQPQIDLATGSLRGFEALARWQDEGEWIPPDRFIPAAEQAGLIDDVGSILLRKSLALVRKLLDEGLNPGILALNISACQLQRENFAHEIRQALEAAAIPPARVELEITETALLTHDSPTVRTNMLELRELGVTLALDDFGTGYSSLTLLRRLQVDVIKIDRGFVREIETNEEDAEIVRAIIGLGRSLRLQVVAEGIETASVGDLLDNAGCHIGQGYHFARPMLPDAVKRYLREKGPIATLESPPSDPLRDAVGEA